VCCVTGPLQRPWTLSETQRHTRLQKGAVEIFFIFFLCLQKHIYLFLVTLSFIYLFLVVPAPLAPPLESCSMTPTLSPSPPFPPPPLSFNTAAVGNQTALKQIDVLFNIVVTTSQGPHAPALLTTAGLLSPAMAATLLVASMIYHKKREGDCESGKREKRGAMERKDPWITIESLAPLIDTV